MFFGSGVYFSQANYVSLTGTFFTTWWPENLDPLTLLDRVVDENQGNLVQLWGFEGGAGRGGDLSPVITAQYGAYEDIGVTPPAADWQTGCGLTSEDWPEAEKHADRRGAGLLKFAREAANKGLYTLFIYTDAEGKWVRRLSEVGEYYLGYDFGERFAFRLDDGTFERAELNVIAREFVDRVSAHVRERRAAGWGQIAATSGSFGIDYEVIAGVDIPLMEDFAFAHLNMASSLSRGLYRQFKLPLWGSHMAHEHYSWIPYASRHKFSLLRAAFELKYMAGCKMLINESGNWGLQGRLSEDSPMHALPAVEVGNIQDRNPRNLMEAAAEAAPLYHTIDSHSPIARKYQKTISDFYDFLKAEGTPPGQPEVTLAIAKGNYDFATACYSSNKAIAGMYSEAERNPLWFEAAPEKGWTTVQNTFYPRPEVLAPYRNAYLSGTPYGMVDIVSFALDQIDADFLRSHYKALIFSGWNTASAHQYKVLTDYVRAGGILFLAIPHLSTNCTRNYLDYSAEELLHGGDFSELCGVRVKGKGPRFYWASATPEQGDELGFAFPRRFGPMGTCTGDIEITDSNTEILVVEDERLTPVLLRRKLGEGEVYFLNSWSYPGALLPDIGPGHRLDGKNLIETIYSHIAERVRGSVWITSDGRSAGAGCAYIAFSYFPETKTVFLKNIDYENERTCFLHINGLPPRQIELRRGEFRIIHDQTSKSFIWTESDSVRPAPSPLEEPELSGIV